MVTNQKFKPCEPQTKSASLMNSEGRVTLHVYERSNQFRDDKGDVVVEHLFKCTDTGAIRRWGLDVPEPMTVH